MDKIDLVIIRNLLENCRLTFRELADANYMSVSAIHKRIKKLEENGIITAYTARPSIIALKCLKILIYGTSHAKSLDTISQELGQQENTRFVGIAGNKFLIIIAYLRDISELQDYGSFISRTAQISNPTIGIIDIPYITTPEPLSTIDYKILKCLNRDARKSIMDITDDTGLSAKTIKKRLERMMENNLTEFTIEWFPMYENCFLMGFNITLNQGTDLSSTIGMICEKYSDSFALYFSYSNIPFFFTLIICPKSAQNAHELQKDLEKEGLKNITPFILLSVKWYECWIDQLLRTK
ncbi:MAG: winged helix-turn-helix transcriptional regulator [Candidatus Hermodarchaeota archaeon]